VQWPAPRADRPYVAINMVSSVDGKAVVGGQTAGLGSPTDRLLLRKLRSLADAVLVGLGTLRAERYLPTVPEPYVPLRQARGLADQPLAVLVSGSGRLPLERGYFRRAGLRRVLLTSAAGAAALDPAAAASLDVLAVGQETVDLAAGLRTLRAAYGVRWLLAEGGPTLNHALLAAGLVDELFLTVAPRLVGGPAVTIVEGAAPLLPTAAAPRLLAVHAHDGELYLRYAVAGAGVAAPGA
jgi:riboflavin biosynthesis pyrimidine reductase